MYQALYRKWRPKTFSDVVGQDHITSTLRRQVAEGRTSHAYLFTGTRGTGKTTCAKILAKAVNCENPQDGNPCNACPACLGIDAGTILDVVEMDAASNNGVDNARALREDAIYSPAQVKRRVYIIDEVHMLTRDAFNALLKIMEEPPEHLMFILATTELQKVPATILSRCQRFSFRRILPRDITQRLACVAEQEKIDLTADGAELLARLSDGALRDALSLLDQCAAQGGAVDAAAVLDTLGLAGMIQTAQLMECILRRSAQDALLLFDRLYAAGKDVAAVLRELAALARDLLIAQTAPEGGAALLTSGCDGATMARLGQLAAPAQLIRLNALLQKTLAELVWSANRRTDAELCLLRACDDTLSGDLDALCARIERVERRLERGVPAAPERPAPPAERAPEPPREEAAAPLPFDEPEEEEGPPPYGEPVPPAPEPETPEAAAPVPEEPAPQREQAAAAPAADADVFSRLMERYKNRLEPAKRSFLGMTQGRYADGLLTVYCASDVIRGMLDEPAVTAVLAEVTGSELGRAVRVRFVEGKPEDGGTEDRMQELVRMGSRFGNFTVK